MSSVLIRGMERPECCGKCALCVNGFTDDAPMYECAASGDDMTSVLVDDHGKPFDFRPDWCPLVEVKEPHWIPVTERLPETTDAVLTTYIVNGDRSRRYVEESSYYGSDESWCSPWDEYRDVGTSIEVIAWMPMPAPWKGE